VNAWHLFPVKEKAVTENKDNSVSYGVMGTACLVCLIVGILIGGHMTNSSKVREHTMTTVNYILKGVALTFHNNSLKGINYEGTMFDIDSSEIKATVLNQFRRQ
jgi:hypothetical protein